MVGFKIRVGVGRLDVRQNIVHVCPLNLQQKFGCVHGQIFSVKSVNVEHCQNLITIGVYFHPIFIILLIIFVIININFSQE